jgi:hypothetical protein
MLFASYTPGNKPKFLRKKKQNSFPLHRWILHIPIFFTSGGLGVPKSRTNSKEAKQRERGGGRVEDQQEKKRKYSLERGACRKHGAGRVPWHPLTISPAPPRW